jgi:multidrug efflux pump subunit AcrB
MPADGRLRRRLPGLIRKSAFSLLFLGLVALAAGWFGKTLPTGFLPEEDQGFLYINVQLPFAASMDRTVAVCRRWKTCVWPRRESRVARRWPASPC